MKWTRRGILAGLVAGILVVWQTPAVLAADDADTLDGAWQVVAIKHGSSILTASGGKARLTIKGDSIGWTRIKFVFDREGKGTIKIDSSQQPGRLTIKDKDKTYKGLYQKKGNSLNIVLSEEGGDFPGKLYDSPPDDFKGAVIGLSKAK